MEGKALFLPFKDLSAWFSCSVDQAIVKHWSEFSVAWVLDVGPNYTLLTPSQTSTVVAMVVWNLQTTCSVTMPFKRTRERSTTESLGFRYLKPGGSWKSSIATPPVTVFL